MDIKEAQELCEEYGWEVSTGKWFLESAETGDKVIFQTNKEFFDYAETIKKSR